jgi:hypothetical protein
MKEGVEYQGLRLSPMVVKIFEGLRMHPQFKDWIMSIVNAQSRYNDVPSNFGDQVIKRQQRGAGILPDLARAIMTLGHDTAAIFGFIGCFAHLVQIAILHVISYDAYDESPFDESQLSETLDEVAKSPSRAYLGSFLGQQASSSPIPIRVQHSRHIYADVARWC